MPTAYTIPIKNGIIAKFSHFAMNCALQFVDDLAPAQPVHQPHDQLDRLASLSPLEAQRQCQQDHSRAMARWRERSIADARLRAKYHSMLAQVNAWVPPTPDHVKLQEFMRRQLILSLDADCGGEDNQMPRLLRWPDWLAKQRKIAQFDISFLSKTNHIKSVVSKEQDEWLATLSASFAPAPTVSWLPSDDTEGGAI
jgi:hypothetical protein